MRTRILKLDGLQKSLTITAINHPGVSIFSWKRLCRQQQTCKTKAQAEKGCHALDGKGCHSRVSIGSSVKEAAVGQRLRSETSPTTVTIMKVQETRGPKLPTIFLGSMLALQGEVQPPAYRKCTRPSPQQPCIRWEDWVEPQCLFHPNPQVKGLGGYFLFTLSL